MARIQARRILINSSFKTVETNLCIVLIICEEECKLRADLLFVFIRLEFLWEIKSFSLVSIHAGKKKDIARMGGWTTFLGCWGLEDVYTMHSYKAGRSKRKEDAFF